MPRHPNVECVDWPGFLKPHDLHFDTLPQGWQEAPHFGNALIGSMLYRGPDGLCLEVFRADVHDHRDERYGWAAYSRPHFRIGHFSLHTVGNLAGCHWRKDLWNAELTGTITTDKGEIRIRHFVHACWRLVAAGERDRFGRTGTGFEEAAFAVSLQKNGKGKLCWDYIDQ